MEIEKQFLSLSNALFDEFSEKTLSLYSTIDLEKTSSLRWKSEY